MQASRYQIILISGSDKIIWSKKYIQKLKKRFFENLKNDNEINFRKSFERSSLPKIKLRYVELNILSTYVSKSEKWSHDFSPVMLLGVAKIKNRKITFVFKFFIFLLKLNIYIKNSLINDINRETMNSYEHDFWGKYMKG